MRSITSLAGKIRAKAGAAAALSAKPDVVRINLLLFIKLDLILGLRINPVNFGFTKYIIWHH